VLLTYVDERPYVNLSKLFNLLRVSDNVNLRHKYLSRLFNRLELRDNYLFRLATFPQGVLKGVFALARPPFGWSVGFFAIPRTLYLNPLCIEYDALLTWFILVNRELNDFDNFENCENIEITFKLPEGNLINIASNATFSFNTVEKLFQLREYMTTVDFMLFIKIIFSLILTKKPSIRFVLLIELKYMSLKFVRGFVNVNRSTSLEYR
jgi:hypothetical protein